MGNAAQAQAGRDRARDARLKAARERRLKLDPDQLVRERRIDEASVDVEVAWEERAQAEQAVVDAEIAAAAAIDDGSGRAAFVHNGRANPRVR